MKKLFKQLFNSPGYLAAARRQLAYAPQSPSAVTARAAFGDYEIIHQKNGRVYDRHQSDEVCDICSSLETKATAPE